MIQTRWEGTEELWTSAFVNAEGVSDLDISGDGTIDGSGEEWVQQNPYRRPSSASGSESAAPVARRHGLAGSPIQGVVFKDCKIAATKGFKLDHARNVDLTGLSLDVKQGEAITKVDVE